MQSTTANREGHHTSSRNDQEEDRLTRLRLCNEWDLVPAEDYHSMNRYNDAKIAELHQKLEAAERRDRRKAKT